tara:strand:- start:57 stop:323 length:267 start_codon:yes stop_codon:yes gene_type:complete
MIDDPDSTVGAGVNLSPLAWRTIEHRDGTRTVTLGGQAVGYYSLICRRHARGNASGWRGVTHRGQLVYAKTERAVRENIQEVYNADRP